ncbi:MAG: FAD-dependent oxidoreductase, partial [Rubellimicrobium sp.]|nr:FAD-dependent oxidoreductase [Rubellimicrobium sp.]
SQAARVALVLRQALLAHDMAPDRSMAADLSRAFRDPRLAQLFGRYATYVGGSPYLSPALLSLVSTAEARGVWAVEGGMHRLACAIEALARARGAAFRYGQCVRRIVTARGKVTGVETAEGFHPAEAIVFNGDPRALRSGLLGEDVIRAVPWTTTEPRSLSAFVHAFAARAHGPAISHHTVFFGSDPRAEFDALAQGHRPADATLYLCAQDRTGEDAPEGPERFEIILNGPPVAEGATETERDIASCQTQVFTRLASFGLRFDPEPGSAALTTPQGFSRLFPASSGSLYGRSPHGLTAGLKRPTARTGVGGLYLCGGGAHPGAGVPMATLSARHAAEAIMTDLALPSTCHRTAMPGGMSTGSAIAGPKPSRS